MSTHPLFLIVVFDGFRLDMATPGTTPNLCKFMAEGVNFPNARSVFPTSTRTNAAALACGATPRRNGIVQNKYYDPNIRRDCMFQPNKVSDIEAGMAAYNGKLLDTPPLGDLAAAAGYTMATILSGSAGTSRLINPGAKDRAEISLGFIDWADSCPPDVVRKMTQIHGSIPPPVRPNIDAIRIQTDIVIDTLYPRYLPDIAIVWFSEPDQTHHYHGVNSPKIGQAIHHVDAQFGRLLDWRRESDLRDRLQVIAISDHGHLTTSKRVDVNAEAAIAGFVIGDHFEDGADYAGYTSYSGSLRVRDGDHGRMANMVGWLGDQPWCGLIFTPGGDGIHGRIPGTFDHALALIDHPRAPEIYYIMQNDDAVHGDGIVGSCFYNGVYPEGGGTHGGLHAKELQIVMAAQGTMFKDGLKSTRPAGIIDIAPTILHLLGLEQPNSMDGRILGEALAESVTEPPEAVSFVHSLERRRVVQHLKLSCVGSTTYLDAGWIE
jgi:predicted AlkP superfamily pyrophosphatase or phosphodiesterase